MTRTLIYRCPTCHEFTMHEKCPRDQAATKNPMPPKYSPEDPYGEYRRKLRRLPPTKGG